MNAEISRRDVLRSASLAMAAGTAATIAPAMLSAVEPVSRRTAAEPFGYMFNTSTIRGQTIALPQEVEIVAKAGYHAIEPWTREIDAFVQEGGSLKDLGKKIADLGLTVESAIGFAEWIVDDGAKRAQGLETARRDMDRLVQLGGKRIAAPPVGATNQTDLNLSAAAERYHALLEIGRNIGIVPQVEVWGFSKSLSKLGETLFVAAECRHADACILPDIYHLYKGGSDFEGVKLLSSAAVHVFHVNDYPADPPRAMIADANRVYPGDGVAPLKPVLRTLRDSGFRGYLSLELFNRDYWKQDPFEVARTGLEKMRTTVQHALS